eukprot:IDg15941t1
MRAAVVARPDSLAGKISLEWNAHRAGRGLLRSRTVLFSLARVCARHPQALQRRGEREHHPARLLVRILYTISFSRSLLARLDSFT